jgi:hypothetical protein
MAGQRVPGAGLAPHRLDDTALASGDMAQTAPPPGSPDTDWTAQAADHIESVIDAVREKTTVPVTTIARALVFGVIALAMGFAAMIFVVIGLLRLHVYVPFKHNEARRVWVTDAGAGAIFLLAGGLLWRKRRPREKR